MTDTAPKPETKADKVAFKYKRRDKLLELNERTLDQLTNIAAHDHTQTEAAGLLGVSLATLTNFLAEHEEAREAWEDGRRKGRATLRRLGFSHAKDDPSTWRFLAKQKRLKLGYEDKPEVPAGGTTNVQVNISLEEAQKRIQELTGKIQVKPRAITYGLPPKKPQGRQR